MKIVVFLGNRIPVAEAQAILDAVYLPAVETGDVQRVLAEEPSAIGIIDGSFAAPVWHKELLLALSRGVHLFGACGIGALRAVELEPFGMVGVGRVFEDARAGVLAGDDELACGPNDDSVARVDVRDSCLEAGERAVITREQAVALMRAATSIHYRERTYSRILLDAKAAGVPDAAVDAFRRFLSIGRSLTARDAVAMLDVLREFAAHPPRPLRPPFSLERTPSFDRLDSYVLQAQADPNLWLPLQSLENPESGAHLDQPARGGETLKVVRKKVLLRLLAGHETERLGISPTDDDVHQMARDFRRQFGLLTEADTREWLAQAGLSVEDFTEVMSDFAAIRILERLYVREIDRGVPNHIRINAVRDFVSSRSNANSVVNGADT